MLNDTTKDTKLVTSEMIEAGHEPRVFCGGTCNIIDKDGNNVRNDGRDLLEELLSERGIPFFDPQIHPTTHGREYAKIDEEGEVKARERAEVIVYEITTSTSALVTFAEILQDAYAGRNAVIWFRPNAHEYEPEGIGSLSDVREDEDLRARLSDREYQFFISSIKDVNRLWGYLSNLLPEDHKLTRVETDDVHDVLAIILSHLKS